MTSRGTFMRSKPTLRYCGLTIILSNPSRLDTARLVTGGAQHVLNGDCLRPELNMMQCDIRIADDPSPWLPETKCILLLGEYALHKYIPTSRSSTLNEMRGSPQLVGGIPAIASYFPQDCVDIKDYERTHNTQHRSMDEEDDNDVDDEKALGATSRANFWFWLRADIRKAKWILKHGPLVVEPSPTYVTQPDADTVINLLTKTKGEHLYFDMETDWEEQNMQCFSFSFDGQTVYNIPTLDYNYRPAYSGLAYIIRALVRAIKDNTLVAHNGATFDFIVLGYKYRIPIYKVYDTMVAMHRCFPSIEKSLGHCTSYWTNQQFHKDQDSHGYHTYDQMMRRLKYCGKDVLTMYLIKQAIDKYAKTRVGLQHSIDTAMASITPYITATMQGIKYDEDLRKKLRNENDRLMMQYNRMIDILVGQSGMEMVKSCVKKPGSMANSNKQCVQYFHNILGYPIVNRTPPNKDGIRNPSLAKQALFKLRLKNDNPVIDLCNIYRGVKLETSTPLGFDAWKNDKGEIRTPAVVKKDELENFNKQVII